MSLRQHWLRRVFDQSLRAARRSRRRACRPSIETLEVRQYLSAVVSVVGDGHTLSIVGDAADDTISIIESAYGIEVRINADSNRFFTGIDAIQVDAGDGRDDVRVYYAYYVQTDRLGAPLQAADLHVQLGAGNDLFWLDGELPPGPCRADIQGGSGDDDLTLAYRVGSWGWELPPGPCNVAIDAGDGLDVVRFTVTNDMIQSHSGGGGGAGRTVDAAIVLGAGNDSFVGDIQLPPGPCNVMVDAGLGNDNLALMYRFGSWGWELPPGPCTVLINAGDGIDTVRHDAQLAHDVGGLNITTNLGLGNDQFQANLLYSTGLAVPSELPPGPCRFVTNGDDGVDSINALIGLLSQAVPVGDVQAAWTMLFDGGDGSDVIRNTVRNVNLNGATSIDMQGGFGDDVVIQSLQKVTVNAGLNFNAHGGHGNDVMTFGASSGVRSIGFVPALIVNSAARISVDGGFGNDRLFGQVTPLISPTASLDLAFIGGELNDVLNLQLSLEPTSPAGATSGPLTLTALGGHGDDHLNLAVQNLGASATPLILNLDGGIGTDTATVSPDIDASDWTM